MVGDSRGPSHLTDLRGRLGYRPDVVGLACRRMAAARERTGLSREAFAASLRSLLGWTPAPEMIRHWETTVAPPGEVAEAADIVAAQAGAADPAAVGLGEQDVDGLVNVADFTTWITATNTSDAAIEHIERVASALAEMHTQVPDRKVLADVLQLHRTAQLLLRGGRRRLRQTRELVRLDGNVLAHASVLLSNLGENQAAEESGRRELRPGRTLVPARGRG